MPTAGEHSDVLFKTVIFATDFSEASRTAGIYASALSVHFATKLIVTHAFTVSQASLAVEAEHPQASLQRRDLHRALDTAARALVAGDGEAEPVLLEGDPFRVIPTLTLRNPFPLVVMGTHGRGTMDRFFLGSTAEGVLRHSSGPALTVGPNVDMAKTKKLNVRRILYATDCSVEAAHAAPFAAALADAFPARIDVLNVADACEMRRPDQTQDLQQHLHRALNSVVPEKASEFSEPETFVSVGDPQEEILRHIKERDIDLLVIGLRRNLHLGMKNRTSGVFPIIVASKCPVLTVASGSFSKQQP